MSRRGDWLSALAWAGFGALLLAASWRMERLENQGAPPWSAPGLTPGMVGALMIAFSLALAWQALRRPRFEAEAGNGAGTGAGTGAGLGAGNAAGTEAGNAAGSGSGALGEAPPPAWAGHPSSGSETRRVLLAAALCVLFAGVSLGRGLPFQVETAAFILVFICVFSWHGWRAEGRVARGVARSLLIAVVAALSISWLFESLFLVRLP